ncbi:DUF6691 family protein [Maribacter sp. HTCC2170]|uniref:DUF6691 family protein n=1 Tax=Maribacter sp. (strain HTCC2170 / KCCM 42371) TaxID=313603 RepID=UPI00006AFDBD|nr:DUF6691 family protein [Maribacter sp. HTCC2170]EAR01350.1 hypothetical protein FB2170_11536 [Maribacter sp. HTCC2170]
MGPLIPNEYLSYEWNIVIALLIGLVFGFILESSGFSSSRKLAGVFYGYDFAVLKVFFTAAIVSVIGLYYMDYLGWVDMSMLYVHPTYIWGAIVGGAIMGLGFITGGFCPGTSLCAVAIGKLDAWVYVLGIMVGVLIFSEAFGGFESLYNDSYLGNITLAESLELPASWIIFAVTIMALVAFFIADIIRKRVSKIFY